MDSRIPMALGLGSWGVGARLQLHCWHESLGPGWVLKEIYFVKVCNCKVQSFLILSYPVYFKSLIGRKQAGWSSEKLLLLDFVGDCPRLTISSRLHSIRTWSIEDSSPSKDLSTLGEALAWDCMKRRQKSSFASCTLRSQQIFGKNQLALWSRFLDWFALTAIWLGCHCRLWEFCIFLAMKSASWRTRPLRWGVGTLGTANSRVVAAKNDLHLHGRVLKVECWD